MKHRKAVNARGYLDGLAVLADQYASFLTRRNAPPHVTLERIANLAEKAQSYQHTRVVNGEEYPDTRPSGLQGREKQREECLKRIWDSYLVVQESEIMHKGRAGEDESWGSAKEVDGKWTPEPITYYGDALDEVLADELHGNTANGVTPIRNSGEE